MDERGEGIKTFRIQSISQMEELVRYIWNLLEQHPIVFLSGDLGAGKTTLVKQLVAMMGSEDEVNSPTFSLVNEYLTGHGILYHMDLYRLETEEECMEVGLEEYLNSGNPCLIEWPEIILHWVEDPIWIKISLNSDGSRIFSINLSSG